ncbi:MAG TPA: ATP-binding protein [Burkholderiaceae bacterium]|nr:ATP-binding protein [Burkholderiaceae bacterium]
MLTTLRIALLTIVYAVVGAAALQLAIPPGYAAPIFPPAGIMLAAGLIYGYSVLPAAFLGSLLMRAIVFGGLLDGPSALQAVAVVVSLASTLQTAVAIRLTKALCGPALALDTPSTIVRFVLLCPLVALVGSGISIPALIGWNIIAPGNALFDGWSWWLGDTLGILVGAPIVLALFGRPRENWSARKWTVALPLLVMIGLGVTTAGTITRWEDQRIEARFKFDAQKLVDAFRNELRLDVLAVQAAALGQARFDEAGESTRWMNEAPSIRSIGRVSVGKAGGATALPVVEVASSRRADDERILASAAVRAALERAQSTGRITASEPWTFGSGAQQEVEFLVWLPDSGRAGATEPKPAYAVINVRRLDPRLLIDAAGGLAICWVDRTGATARRVAGPAGCERPVEGQPLKYEAAMPLWGRDWLVRVVATPRYGGALRSWGPWAFSALAVLAIGTTGAFLLLLTGRAQTVGRLVQERTGELEREKAALRGSEELLRNILDHASVGIAIHGRDGRFLRVNPHFCEITGYSAEELYRMHWADLIYPADRGPDDGWPACHVAQGIAARDARRELRYIRKNGAVVNVLVCTALGGSGPREADYAVMVAEDITERIRLREAERARLVAEEASHAKDDFLSRMSHELRTPLNAILGFAQILAGSPRESLSEPQRQQVGHIETAGWHLLAMIDDLLDLSRIEAGTVRLSLEPTALDLVIHDTVTMLTSLAVQQSVAVRVDIDSGATLVLADTTRLKQVLANLLSNAIKYNRRGGTVTLSARPGAGETVIVKVSDTGQGMSEAQQAELFQPFNRLGRESGPVPGTGIGLVVTKRLVELMNGTIEVSSVEAGGSTFSIRLPAAHADPVLSPQSGQHSEGAAPYGNRRVAYFEDNALNAEVMRAVLAARPQVRLDVYTRAAEGLEAIRSEAVDLLLMDMSLPDARGLDILRGLKGDPSTMRTPVIIVSADTVAEHVREALRNGALAYIVKPIERTRVLEQVDRALASRPA